VANEKILVADDEKDIGRLLELTLSRAGYQVIRASDGEEALAKIGQDRPDLVLLDVMMPKLDGIQVCRRLKGNSVTASIPVIMLTAKAQVTDKVTGFSAGADDYVSKPFNHREIVARVRTLLQRSEKIRYLNPLMGVLGDWFTDKGVEQLGKELEVAQDIQRQLLPRETPELPGLEIGAVLFSSKSVGGDFYDFLPGPNGQMGIALGDVSGKGIPAALFMVMVRTLLRVIAADLKEPAEVLAQANKHLTRDIPPGMFVTMLYAILDGKGERLAFANAGHWAPILLRDGQDPVSLEADGAVLGVAEDVPFTPGELKLQPGDLVTLFTDGVVESVGYESGQTLGIDGLVALLTTHREKSTQAMAEAIATQIRESQKGALQDDLTLLILKATQPIGDAH